MFLHLCVILFTGGLCPSMHHRARDRGSLSRGLCLGGGLCPGGSLSGGVSVRRGICPGVLSRGVSVQGLCQGSLGGHCQGDPPPYGNKWVVYMLLECILVSSRVLLLSITMWLWPEAMRIKQHFHTLGHLNSPSCFNILSIYYRLHEKLVGCPLECRKGHFSPLKTTKPLTTNMQG